jgi:hypothetical protein
MKRRKYIRRSTKPMKRGRLNPISSRKKRLDNAQRPMLDDFRRLFPHCQRCGRTPATDIHEILAGSFRERARGERACILHLCRACHECVQTWERARQLALKAWADPKGFDLFVVNEILGCPTAVTMAEVDKYLPEMRG